MTRKKVTTIVAAATGAAAVLFSPLGCVHLARRDSGSEASAIGSLRAINSAQAAYAAACSAVGGYATDLADLVSPPRGMPQGFISPDLNVNGVVKSEYIIRLARDAAPGVMTVGSASNTCNTSTTDPVSSYFASAEPRNARGQRFFATDSRGVIFVSKKGPIGNPIRPGPDIQPIDLRPR